MKCNQALHSRMSEDRKKGLSPFRLHIALAYRPLLFFSRHFFHSSFKTFTISSLTPLFSVDGGMTDHLLWVSGNRCYVCTLKTCVKKTTAAGVDFKALTPLNSSFRGRCGGGSTLFAFPVPNKKM